MNYKVFEYHNKDIPFLKREIIFRSTFAMLFFATFVWQFISMIENINTGLLSVGKIVSSIFVLIACLLFSVLSILYVLKTLRVISVIKLKGKCVSSVEILFKLEKDSFIKLYSIITEILALIAAIVLICALTYSILEVSYYATLSYFLPLLITISLSAFYSVFHIRNEIKIVKTVEEFNAIYG